MGTVEKRWLIGLREKTRKPRRKWLRPGRKKRKERRGRRRKKENFKGSKGESDQLEKSDVSEEHGQPNKNQKVYVSSSDDTRTSNNFNRLSSVGYHHNCSIHVSDVLLGMESSRPTSARLRIVSHEKTEMVLSKERLCSTFGRSPIQGKNNAESVLNSSLLQSNYLKMELQFRDLIEKWVSPQLHLGCRDFDNNMNWLFEKNPHHRKEPKRFKSSFSPLCNRSPSLWPRACYLPEADLYALPYSTILVGTETFDIRYRGWGFCYMLCSFIPQCTMICFLCDEWKCFKITFSIS